MPSFSFYEDISVDEFLSECSKKEINDVIESLVDSGYIPEHVTDPPKLGRMQTDFSSKLDMLKEKYYSLTQEEEKVLEEIFKKYL